MFGWARRIFNVRRTAAEEPRTSRVPFVVSTTAGVSITPDLALRNSVVWACLRYLTQSVAQLPWRVLEVIEANRVTTKFADFEAQWRPNHPVDTLLGREPNREMASFSFRETMLGWSLLWGNAFAEIQRDGSNRPVALWPLHPSRVTIDRDAEGVLFYEVSGERGPQVRLRQEDVFHVHGFGDGPIGYNVVQYAAQSIGLAAAQELFGAAFFGNGAHMGGFLIAPGQMGNPAVKNLLDSVNSRHRGPQKAHGWHVLDAGFEVKETSFNPKDSQAIEARQNQVEEITRWFGVPPHKVQHLLRSTFNNVEHQSIEAVVDSIAPWVTRFEQEADRKLFLSGERPRHFTKMSLAGLLRGDVAARAAFYQSMRNMGVLSVNEIRAAEGMNAIGPEGDIRVMQGQYMTLQDIARGRVPDMETDGAENR